MPDTDPVDQLEIRQSSLTSTSVWKFFDNIDDVPNLNAAEERAQAWEAVIDGDRVGMVVIDTFGTPFVSRIAIQPAARRAGVGIALLEQLLNEFDRIRCRVRKDNIPGIHLVETVGFHRGNEGRHGELWWYDTNPDESSPG